MKNIILWVVSIFLLLMSLVAFSKGAYLSGAISLVGSAITLPLLQPLLEKYTKHKWATWQIVLSGLLLLLISTIVVPKEVRDRIDAESKASEMEESKRQTKETLRQIAEQKRENEKAKQAKNENLKKEAKEMEETEKEGITKYGADGNAVGEAEEKTERPAPQFGGLVLMKEDFGDQWAFSVDWGEITCENSMMMFYAYGKRKERYAVNGTSRTEVSAGRARDIEEIWLKDPQYEGINISITPIMEKGLSLCNY